ncbi:Thioredoxin reductase [Syntrophobacter sp. SbD1]|nr:Thioredoxin reductase [Syntrophobacter sp. SbD1]
MNNNGEIYDLVILGGGPAGLSAGLYAMRAVLSTILVERATPGGQVAITKDVENYPGLDEITGLDLSDKLLQHAQSYGLEVIQDEAVSIDPGPDLHSVILGSGKILKAHAVIIATGGAPRKLGVPGESEFIGRGVSYCAKCDGFFFQDRVVTVVGGGDTAIEEALYLSKLASKVYLVHRRSGFRASKILQKRIHESSVELVLNSAVTQIYANEDGVHSIVVNELLTGEQRTIETEGVFIFVGLMPNNRIVPAGIILDSAGYAVTDEKCATRIPGIYIAGDLKTKFAKQIVVAAAEGCTAALAAADYIDQKKNIMGIFDTRSRVIKPQSVSPEDLRTGPQASITGDPTH